MKLKETRLMKIALTSQNRRDLTAHAGRCRHFVVYDTHSPQLPVQWLQLPLAGTLHEADPVADHPLAGIDVLITAGAVDCLRQRLARAGIRLVISGQPTPDMALADYLANPAAQPLDTHGDCQCQCAH